MPPSYQTVPLAVPPKTLAIPPEEPAPTSVPTMKKLVVAAMVGTALVGGYSYGSSTNPAMINNVNGFAAGVSYSTYPFSSCEKAWPGQELYYLPDVVPATIPNLPSLAGNPATICFEGCFYSESQAKTRFHDIDPTYVHPPKRGGCGHAGYTVYDYEKEPVIGFPIFKSGWYV